MGCGSSHSVSTVDTNKRATTSSRPELRSSRKKNQVVPNSDSKATIISKEARVIQVSPSTSAADVNSFTKRREISASSTRTADSGICEVHEDVITADCSGNQLEKAAERPNTPELVLEGRACPRLQSGKEKRRIELEKKNSESSVPRLPPLESNSLMGRPQTRGGIKFDVMLCPETGNIKKAPANLPKLERRKRRKKLTKEELEEKMRKASERREEHRQKIIEKSQAFLNHYGNGSDHVKRVLENNNENEKQCPSSSVNDEILQDKYKNDNHSNKGDKNTEEVL